MAVRLTMTVVMIVVVVFVLPFLYCCPILLGKLVLKSCVACRLGHESDVDTPCSSNGLLDGVSNLNFQVVGMRDRPVFRHLSLHITKD